MFVCVRVHVSGFYIHVGTYFYLQYGVGGTTAPGGDLFLVPMRGSAVFELGVRYVMGSVRVRVRL